jgi:hypothetical protein
VLEALPVKLIELVEKNRTPIYYTTQPLSYDPNELVVGKYHIGITTLYLDKQISSDDLLSVDFLENYKHNITNKFVESGKLDNNPFYFDYETILVVDKINSNRTILELLNEQFKGNPNEYDDTFFVRSIIKIDTYVFNKVCIKRII